MSNHNTTTRQPNRQTPTRLSRKDRRASVQLVCIGLLLLCVVLLLVIVWIFRDQLPFAGDRSQPPAVTDDRDSTNTNEAPVDYADFKMLFANPPSPTAKAVTAGKTDNESAVQDFMPLAFAYCLTNATESWDDFLRDERYDSQQIVDEYRDEMRELVDTTKKGKSGTAPIEGLGQRARDLNDFVDHHLKPDAIPEFRRVLDRFVHLIHKSKSLKKILMRKLIAYH